MSQTLKPCVFNNTGIYTITNTITGKLYVGSAINLKKRQREHLRALNSVQSFQKKQKLKYLQLN